MYSTESLEYLRQAIEMLEGAIIPALETATDEDSFNKVIDDYFQNRDNTVRDAGILARMLSVTLASIAMDYMMDHIADYARAVNYEYHIRLAQELN